MKTSLPKGTKLEFNGLPVTLLSDVEFELDAVNHDQAGELSAVAKLPLDWGHEEKIEADPVFGTKARTVWVDYNRATGERVVSDKKPELAKAPDSLAFSIPDEGQITKLGETAQEIKAADMADATVGEVGDVKAKEAAVAAKAEEKEAKNIIFPADAIPPPTAAVMAATETKAITDAKHPTPKELEAKAAAAKEAEAAKAAQPFAPHAPTPGQAAKAKADAAAKAKADAGKGK